MSSESKSALVLFGSPKLNGFSARLMNSFVKHLSGYDIRYIYSYESDVRPCIDCGFCKNIQGCRFSDMSYIDKCLRECDLIIVVSPVYNYSFPSPLKAVFDRMQRYYSAKFSMGIQPVFGKHKKAVLLVTCGMEDTSGAEMMEKQIVNMFKVLNADFIGKVVMSGTDKIDKENHNDLRYEKPEKEAEELAAKI